MARGRISSERLQEMREAELVVVRMSSAPKAVRRNAEEHAEALGELLEWRLQHEEPKAKENYEGELFE